jgi:hypothetical protein
VVCAGRTVNLCTGSGVLLPIVRRVREGNSP